MALLQIIFAIYDELTNAYGKVLENDVTHDAYFVKTCYMKNGEMTGDASLVLNIPFEDWLKKPPNCYSEIANAIRFREQ